MGHTHYFQATAPFTDKQWKNITEAVTKLFAGTDILAGGIGEGDPEVTDKRIWFNGRTDQNGDYETLLIKKNDTEWGFCKTACMPYDAYVVAVHCICHHFSESFKVTSDGRKNAWKTGQELASAAVGTAVQIPDSIRE